jgi:hypothetical protein
MLASIRVAATATVAISTKNDSVQQPTKHVEQGSRAGATLACSS